MSLPREVESAIYDLIARASDPYSCVESHPEYADREAARLILVTQIERAIAAAYARAAEACEEVADRIDEKRGTASDPAAIDAMSRVAMECAQAVREAAPAAEAVLRRVAADAVKPWRELVERALHPNDGMSREWYEDAMALLEKRA